MNRFTDIYAPIIGRVLLGGFFLWDGIEKSLNLAGTIQLLGNGGLPVPTILAVLMIAVEVLGGIGLIVGFMTSTIALALAIYAILTSLLLINFNGETGISLFLRNMAIVGGLFSISALGAGTWDRSRRLKR